MAALSVWIQLTALRSGYCTPIVVALLQKTAETWASTQHIRTVSEDAWQLTISCIAEPVRYRKHLQVAAESCLVTEISVVGTGSIKHLGQNRINYNAIFKAK